MNTTKFDALIFLVDYTSFSEGINSYNLALSGKSLLEHVARATGGAEHDTLPYDEDTVILHAVRRHASARRYTVVLFSDTPLIRKEVIASALDYMSKKDLAVVRLKRGYIFDNLKLDEVGEPDSHPMLKHSGIEEDYVVVNDYKSLAIVGKTLRERIIAFHQAEGVNIVDPATTFIDTDVAIASDVTIFPNNSIKGNSKIEKGATLKENNVIENSVIGENATVTASHIEGSTVCSNATVGPFAHIRPKSKIGRHAKIGNFVEIKNSEIGSGTKVSHLSYIGDAIIEADCNIGCGVTVANFDGKKKSRTVIGEGAFVGSHSVLISPVTVGARSLIAAGSTITEDVEAGALAIARARQTNKAGYAKKYLD